MLLLCLVVSHCCIIVYYDMLTVSFYSSGLRHTITGEPLQVIRYLIDESRVYDSFDIISSEINDSPEDN